MRRVLSLWLPYWQTDLAQADLGQTGPSATAGPAEAAAKADRPLVLFAETAGVARLTAVCPAAAGLGLRPGLTLADARARMPGLAAQPADPVGAAQALDRLADWAMRFTPWVAVDGADGLWLDITGCAHLFGGEAALCRRLLRALKSLDNRHIHARAAVAETPGAAWAVARHGRSDGKEGFHLVAPGAIRPATGSLSIRALRLDGATVAGLDRLGLRRIADIIDLPRAPLARRFGSGLVRRLDQLTGRLGESLSPRRAVPPFRVSRGFAAPVTTQLAAILDRLLETLCRRLSGQGQGARRLELVLFRVDGGQRRLTVGTSRPVAAPAPLSRLFAAHFEALDVGEGLEAMRLSALVTEANPATQDDWERGRTAADDEAMAALIDRLGNRLGPQAVSRAVPFASHIPERAARSVAAWPPPPPAAWPDPAPRPIRLFDPPQPITAMAMVPDAPPHMFRWHGRVHRVVRSTGPERIAPEWWRAADAATRDYYRLEDRAGARFWVFRAGLYQQTEAPRWYLHGLFG